jgi:hypothetical protein
MYIKVNRGWWNKPMFSKAVTPINKSGEFQNPTVTGGLDYNATHIAVFLIHKKYTPPVAHGLFKLPIELYANSITYVDILRYQSPVIFV